MSKRKIFGFVTDPPETFDREAETTLFLMREIGRRGHTVFACTIGDLYLKQNEVWAGSFPLHKLGCLFLRKDPPFDMPYLKHLYLLQKLEGRVFMINKPSAILRHNEKLAALDFPFAPKTFVGAKTKEILKWGRKFSQGIVVKPLNQGGGRGIHWIKRSAVSDQRSVQIIRKMTASGMEPIIAQEYLPAAKKGDKRILLWNGRVLGVFLRVPRPGEFRANLHQGGRFVATTLTPRDRKIAEKVGQWAKKEGLYFVGLDVIGKHLTEINVTSPMGIREVNTLYGLQVECDMIGNVLRWI